jgi:hypothetical protein
VDKQAAPRPTTVPVPQPGPSDPSEVAWGGYLGRSGSFDKPAAAIQLGVRLRLSTHWTIGWDVESNPWISVNGPTFMRAGTVNTFGTVILRFPLAYENFNLRTTLNLGISYRLIDRYGASKGSLGLCGAIYPQGIAGPLPQLEGVPPSYPQYRFSIGLGFWRVDRDRDPSKGSRRSGSEGPGQRRVGGSPETRMPLAPDGARPHGTRNQEATRGDDSWRAESSTS